MSAGFQYAAPKSVKGGIIGVFCYLWVVVKPSSVKMRPWQRNGVAGQDSPLQHLQLEDFLQVRSRLGFLDLTTFVDL